MKALAHPRVPIFLFDAVNCLLCRPGDPNPAVLLATAGFGFLGLQRRQFIVSNIPIVVNIATAFVPVYRTHLPHMLQVKHGRMEG